MAGIKDFSIEDILIMKGIQNVILKMDEVLDLVRLTFNSAFQPTLSTGLRTYETDSPIQPVFHLD